jgi:hypothetical protein
VSATRVMLRPNELRSQFTVFIGNGCQILSYER